MTSDRPDEPDRGIDVDAAFADIVAHYGEVPTADDGPPPGQAGQRPPVQGTDQAPDQATGQAPAPAANPPDERSREGSGDGRADGPGGTDAQALTGGPPGSTEEPRPVLEPRWAEPGHTPATWEDEGHFVPPPAPPLPSVEPRRRAAWLALFGAPLVMLVVIVFGVGLPGWVVAGLALAFIGGFVYLVATMGASGGPDWPDDGAVV